MIAWRATAPFYACAKIESCAKQRPLSKSRAVTKAGSTPECSQAVPHPSTNWALCRLTSEVERDPVHSTRYGRQRYASRNHGLQQTSWHMFGRCLANICSWLDPCLTHCWWCVWSWLDLALLLCWSFWSFAIRFDIYHSFGSCLILFDIVYPLLLLCCSFAPLFDPCLIPWSTLCGSLVDPCLILVWCLFDRFMMLMLWSFACLVLRWSLSGTFLTPFDLCVTRVWPLFDPFSTPFRPLVDPFVDPLLTPCWSLFVPSWSF